ncbi:hypothetical protein MHU86_17967 [Fragilaria crotonensis]|nr:hypothetical protein MHU86_17967 [Fragilaria crotonensis]
MVFSSNVPEKKKKTTFSSWFVPDHEEEEDDTGQASHIPHHTDDKSGPRGSDDRRRSYSGEARPKSAIAIAKASKPRVRTTPLKRTASAGSEPLGHGHLIRMSSRNETAIMISPQKKHEPQPYNEVNNELQSTQSSITNSWAPRLRLYHPAPFVPHKPIENMTNRTQDQQSRNAGMLSLALTEEQKADVEQYVFRGWGSDDDADCVAQSKQFVPPHHQSETKNSEQTTGRVVMEEEALPHSNPQVIQDAIKELQALTGMQVKCLDFTGGDAPLAVSKCIDRKTEIVSRGEAEEIRKEKQTDDHKLGWFFGAPARKDDPLDNDGDLAQPYALIRNDEDEARFRKHCEEEECLRQQEDIRLEEEKKKKKASWFFFSKEEESVEVLDDDKMADALDDLEILAGEVRVSQVKEARLMERDGKEHENHNNGVVGTGSIDGPQRSFQAPQFHSLRQEGKVRVVSDWQMKSLSRFALPQEAVDSDAPLGWKEKGERQNRSLGTSGVLSTKHVFANSLSSIGKSHASEVDTDVNQNPHEECASKDTRFEDVEIDEPFPLPPKASELKKEALISDLSKRDLRWRLNQASVNSVFKEYHSAMADIDHLLPSQDEFDTMKHIGRSIDVQFLEVRNKMLEDGNLSEREVASFFGGSPT